MLDDDIKLGLNVYCIKDYKKRIKSGKFYEIHDLVRCYDSEITIDTIVIKLKNKEFVYIKYKIFFKHFEIKNKAEIRKEKIKKLL